MNRFITICEWLQQYPSPPSKISFYNLSRIKKPRCKCDSTGCFYNFSWKQMVGEFQHRGNCKLFPLENMDHITATSKELKCQAGFGEDFLSFILHNFGGKSFTRLRNKNHSLSFFQPNPTPRLLFSFSAHMTKRLVLHCQSPYFNVDNPAFKNQHPTEPSKKT